MKYITAIHRQQGEGTPSLLLQQFVCRGVPVCFACLERAENEKSLSQGGLRREEMPGREDTEKIKSWLRNFPWPRAVKKPEYWLSRARFEWESMSLREPGRMLLIAVGEWILLLQGERGNRMYLINSSYGRGRAGLIREDFMGNIEPEVGILMAASDFGEGADENKLGMVFCPGELRNEEQMEKRLRELGGQAAVLFLTKEG